jgi:hypothetical protein
MYLFIYALRNDSMFSSVSECKESNGKAVSEKRIVNDTQRSGRGLEGNTSRHTRVSGGTKKYDKER